LDGITVITFIYDANTKHKTVNENMHHVIKDTRTAAAEGCQPEMKNLLVLS
jgi:hypothetical protein